jgi:predicted AAA+ superfamily ATPase
MEQLRLKSNHLVSATPTHFKRSICSQIDWNDRLIGILGARGMGKTTILLQQVKENYGVDSQALYITLDDIYFSGKTLHEFAAEFRNRGGAHIFIDEIHKYPQWSLELKIIYDTLPDLKVTFAGSSTIEMLKHYANLSKRASMYNLQGLSFREYLAMQGIATLPIIELSALFDDHIQIARDLSLNFSIQMYFDKYLTRGYYPFATESYELYKRQMEQVLYQTIESDLAYMEGYDPRNAYKIRQLIQTIAQNVPFKPNLVKISEAIGVHRNTLIGYFFHLEKAKLIQLLYPSGSIISILQKPERVYLNNPNLAQLLCSPIPSRDTLVKTFVMNQVGIQHPLKLAKYDTLDLDGKWFLAIETSRKLTSKRYSQPNTYVIADGLEVGHENKIPLWMVGLGY